MKPVSSLWPVLALFGSLAVGSGLGTAAELAKTNAPGSEAKTEAATLHQQETELAAQFGLLKELATQHRQRADEADKANQPDKAKWEGDLAKELSERVDRTAAQLDETMRQRMAAEATAKSAAATTKPEAADQDEVAYFTRLDTQLWRVEQDIKAALETTKGFSAQLQTNNVPEDMLRISFQVQENNALLRFLERERSDLELKKLQYRALKKR